MDTLKSASRYGKASIIAAVITFGLFFGMVWFIDNGEPAIEFRNLRFSPDSCGSYFKIFVINRECKNKKTFNWPYHIVFRKTPIISCLCSIMPIWIEMDQPEPSLKISPVEPGKLEATFAPIIQNKKLSLDRGAKPLVPLNTVTPILPIHLTLAGIEGFAIFEFTVNENGRVEEIILLEESPEGYGFAKSAKQALKRYKFQPRYENGQPVATIGVRQKFEFLLEDEK